MESANNSSPMGRIIPILIIFGGLVALYYLYQYLVGPKSSNVYTLISNTRPATFDSTTAITITSDKLPVIYEGGEFTLSTWIYVNNWSYRQGFNKSIVSIGGPTLRPSSFNINNFSRMSTNLAIYGSGVFNDPNDNNKYSVWVLLQNSLTSADADT
jgi:hypothetical protein